MNKNEIPRMSISERTRKRHNVLFCNLPFRALFYCTDYKSLYMKVSDGGYPRALRIDTAQITKIDSESECWVVNGKLFVEEISDAQL